jgi:hypothetical protein
MYGIAQTITGHLDYEEPMPLPSKDAKEILQVKTELG